MLHLMTKWYKLGDNFGELWYLPLADDPSARAATLPFTVSGAPTVSGTVPLMVAGVVVPVGVTAGLAVSAVAAAIAAAINANLDLPVTAAVGTGANTAVVTLTARKQGAVRATTSTFGLPITAPRAERRSRPA